MSKPDVTDLRFSSSSMDDFFRGPQPSVRAASGGKVRIANLRQLAGFQQVSEDGTLVRMSQQDFWKLGQDDQGYFIERLVSDDDGPVDG